MPLINKKTLTEQPPQSGPKSLAVALAVARQTKKKTGHVATLLKSSEESRASSIAEAILAKRKALLPKEEPESDLLEEDLALSKNDSDDSDLFEEEEEAPTPTDMISSIRAKLKTRLAGE